MPKLGGPVLVMDEQDETTAGRLMPRIVIEGD
jgi:hypothetical protein